ncbi:MAG: ABC transporter ATP-binding protein [Leptospira sp.]|uniref:ABC transporter ATP-binding protein n=1 Tax=Leptospira paudalimensis TaxID=2950024 RepID=A0ABT3M4N4_9LEPT|nr:MULTISPECIES: ABC transporter ATP-binding protein [Leptospira]MBL0953223.1 ABC transporter ATP-binding protein [Leptospira sp.]MCW7503352.1 ABC transporter ATP-binding protein [Leptospira paudalimensis]
MNYAVDVKNLKKSYKQGSLTISVLQNIHLQIPAKQFVTLMGPSGSGKSTLLNILSAIETADEGSVQIFGQEMVGVSEGKLTEYRRDQIGIVFQFFHLFPYLTAVENVSIPLLLSGKSKKYAEQKSKEILDIVGLNHRWNFTPKEMSGGEKQRVSIARSIVHEPKIIFGDEPTGNLDSKSSEQVIELFQKCVSDLGITVFIVTHNEEIGKSGNSNYHMLDGSLIKK